MHIVSAACGKAVDRGLRFIIADLLCSKTQTSPLFAVTGQTQRQIQ
jgi:hypothetical protein